MEEIQHSLSHEEQILWSHNEETAIISYEIFSIGLWLIVFCGLTVILGFVMSIQVDLMGFPLIFFIFFYGMSVGSIVGAIIQIQIKRKTLRMTLYQLRHYNQFIILTNKRWIQKRYDNFKLNKKRILSFPAQFQGDILFVPLEMVQFYEIDDRSSSTDWGYNRRLRLNTSSAIKTSWVVNLGYNYSYSRSSEQSNPEFEQLLLALQKTEGFELLPIKNIKELQIFNKRN